MKIEQLQPNNWVIEHQGLMVRGDTLKEAVMEYGDGMYERGYQDGKKVNPPSNF